METNTKKQIRLREEVKQKVCERLGISSDTYDEIFFETGCEFLEKKYFPGYVKALRVHPLFWKWWQVQYTIKDREFLRETKYALEKRTSSRYEAKHLGISVTPGKNITGKIIRETALK